MTPIFRKLLVPLDGSAQAERVLPWVRLYAIPSKSQVVLLQVLPFVYPLKGLPTPVGAGEADHYLRSIERELNYEGIPTKMVLRGNSISTSIVETARSEACDLILITTGGTSRAVRWLAGGIAEQVVRLSPIPVLIVRGSSRRPNPRTIVVPQDGSKEARASLPLAQRLAHFHRGRLILLHVTPRSADPKKAKRSPAITVLSRFCTRLRSEGARPTLQLEEGDPITHILSAGRSGDLTVLTTHGRGGMKRWFLGSIAEQVVRKASGSVLVFKDIRKDLRHEIPGS